MSKEVVIVPDTNVTVSQPTALAPQSEMMQFIAHAVTNPDVDVAKLQTLLAMKKELEADEAKRAFKQALHAAQREVPRVQRGGVIDTGKGKMKFAKWEDVDTALRPVMDRHGFSISFTTSPRAEGGMIVTGRLQHIGGHFEDASIPLPADVGAGRNALQAHGSTLSYGKRYLAEMFFNIVRTDEDDDGVKGGTVWIKDEQVEELLSLLKDTKSDESTILQMLFADKVRNVGECTAEQYATVKNALEFKKKQQQGKAR